MGAKAGAPTSSPMWNCIHGRGIAPMGRSYGGEPVPRRRWRRDLRPDARNGRMPGRAGPGTFPRHGCPLLPRRGSAPGTARARRLRAAAVA